jgi:hypothetical protein
MSEQSPNRLPWRSVYSVLEKKFWLKQNSFFFFFVMGHWVQIYRVSKEYMWTLITEISLATARSKINRVHKWKMPKETVLKMVQAVWARARHNPYIENHSMCSILRNYSCKATANVQWEERSFQVSVESATREDSSVYTRWQAVISHTQSWLAALSLSPSPSLDCPLSSIVQIWDTLLS